MKFYHGTIVPNLVELQPNLPVGTYLSEPLVYLTTNRQLALHYIWDAPRLGEVKMPMLDIREDGTLVFQEMFSGALEYFYKGVSGYIYHCEGNYPINSSTKVPTCATSDTPVPVTSVEYIDDVYEHILQYEKQGKFIYEHYEDLPQWRIDLIRGHILRRIKHYDLIEDFSKSSRQFIQEKFPQYWAEAVVLHQHNFL